MASPIIQLINGGTNPTVINGIAYSSLTSAMSAATSGDTLILYAGTYNLGSASLTLKNGVNIKRVGAVTITSSNATSTITDNNVAITIEMDNGFSILNTGGGTPTLLSNSASMIKTAYVNITHAQAVNMVTNSALSPGESYYISDKKVILKAIDVNKFSPEGTYMYSAGKKAWGAFKITGTSGNVSAITIGVDSLLTATQTYSTSTINSRVNPGYATLASVDISLNALTTSIVTNINANGAVNTKYKAYAISNYVIIQAVATGTALNTSAITVTASTLTITSVTAMQGGIADLTTSLSYSCHYDFTNDKLLSLYDPIYDNKVTFDEKTITADLASFATYLMDFNWDNPLFINNRLTNCIITHNFVLAGSSEYTGGMAVIGNDMVNGTFGSNLIIAGEISYNKCRKGDIYQNIVNNAAAGIAANDIVGMTNSDASASVSNVHSD
ncbi:MAG: hypothetical protein ACYDBX_04980, partial [Patescibacteria group bacterium]